jgi:hypothetical protein
MMNGLQTVRRILGYGSAAVAAAAVSYATYAAVKWARYGRVHPDRFPRDDLLDRFLPRPEVDICHRILVGASAATTFAVAREFDLQRSPLVRVILMLRALPSLLRGEPLRDSSRGVVAWTLTMGWVVLAEVPDREIVVGTVTQPWEPVAPSHTLPPEEFAAFNEPGYAKIVYTLAADPLGPNESMFSIRTRVVTTDPVARERFRRYWAVFSPGSLIIRYVALPPVKAEAERRARRSLGEPAHH